MIDIQNHPVISNLLKKLNPETQPVFGIMTSQHMIEHLILLAKLSNGGIKGQLMRSEETAVKWKQGLIYTDMEFPMGIRVPGQEENTLPELRYENLQKAIEKLENELKIFEEFYKDDKEKSMMHPALGLLNYDEWIVFHSKHFAHHFKQFGLV
ncbi:DUF1569 domain-containing protein [Moheibacter sediminis]|uniref:Oxepin-CoA hydrolase / 3-oxo-5,6-dehydrosuberyl-CoA semialdehyde dehydrogenase n=1 Tax=Moheibacter sediminis TaxID=1434700 RepID=A0A1W1ZQJ9_9FLAO|nr:DUF1569 domain-containing protein [Moheibacter sediminis]SMC50820.1 Protein of unknown function [Moheibacter sediminis]